MPSASIIQSPPSVSLSGNPIIFKIAGQNAYSGAGAKYKALLNRNGIFNDGDGIILSWNGGNKSVNLTAKTDIINDTDLTLGANNAEICNKFNTIPDFANDFECFINDAGTISIIARNEGSDYTIVKTGVLPIDLSLLSNGANRSLTSFYKIIATLERDGKLISKHALSPFVDTDETAYPQTWDASKIGYAEIDVADNLQDENIRGHFTLNWEQDEYTKFHDILKSFRLYAHEQSGIPSVNGSGEYSSLLYVLQGKLENFRQGELNYLEKTFFNLLQETQMFLTFAPSTKYIDIYQPEILYFLFAIQGTYRLWCEETFSDGTTETAARDQFTATAFSIYEFQTSYKAIRSNLNKKLVSYKVWLTTNNDIPVSEERTYIIDYAYQNFARYFFFRNSLGVYECLRTTGKAIKSRDIQKDFINIPFDKNFTNLDRQERQLSADAKLAYDMNSGFFVDKYWSDYFQEFLISSDVYWLKKGTAYPVSIQESKNTVSEDGEYNPFAIFQLTHSIHDDFTEKFTANEPISVGDFNPDFNTDFFIGGSIVYFNEEKSQSFTRNNCGQDFNGTLVWYTITAGTYSSRISQADANNKALADIALNGQNYANQHGSCVYNGNYQDVELAIISQSDTTEYNTTDGACTVKASKGIAPYYYLWEDGPTTRIRTGLAPGDYMCMVTDSTGHTAAVNITIARTNLWYNAEQSQTFTRNNCAVGEIPSSVPYTIPARTYSSNVSQQDANNQALADIAANGQNYANANGTCTINNICTLQIIADPEVQVFNVHVDHMNGITFDFNSPGIYQIQESAALITITGQAYFGQLNGGDANSGEDIEQNTVTQVNILPSNVLELFP